MRRQTWIEEALGAPSISRVTGQATKLKSQIALLAELPDRGVQGELASQRDLQGADHVRERLHYATVRPGLGVELDETVAARQTGLGLTGHEEPR